MKYNTLFFSKTRKDIPKFASATVVIGALKVNIIIELQLSN